jgi:hypothetical protein
MATDPDVEAKQCTLAWIHHDAKHTRLEIQILPQFGRGKEQAKQDST